MSPTADAYYPSIRKGPIVTALPEGVNQSLFPLLRDDVRSRVENLQEGYLGHRGAPAEAAAKAALARLRGCDWADPTSHPEAWDILMEESPAAMSRGGSDNPTPAEHARHCAIVAYATHQQGQSGAMHTRGASFPSAVGRLSRERNVTDGEFDPLVRSRFDQVLLAPTWSGRTEHLKTLIRLLKSADIGFDYGEFATDLFALALPRRAPGTRLKWGRAFYTRPASSPRTTTATTTTTGATA